MGEPILGKHTRKVQPRLRMIANGDDEVNGRRAQDNSSIKISKQYPSKKIECEKPNIVSVTEKRASKLKKGHIARPPSNIKSSVFIHCTHSSEEKKQKNDIQKNAPKSTVNSIRENISIASVPLNEIQKLAEDKCISYIELGEPLSAPDPQVNGPAKSPLKQDRKFDTTGGKDVLIGIIDVGGFDFSHEDFLNDQKNKTRFVRIWDQGGNSHPPPKLKANQDGYGSEIMQEHMNMAIKESPNVGLPAHILEPQSQMSPGSHGTHVASIAAGNRGVCRNARIVGVLIDIPSEDTDTQKGIDRRRSFYDSTRVAHAVDYIKKVAEEIKKEEGLDKLPVSINISLGTNGHAHDGTSALSRWVDSLLVEPGISISVAAGNSGQEKAQDTDDYGYIMGRIHSSGKLVAQGLDVDLEWEVMGNTIVDVSENELEIWYSPADRFSVSVKPPGEDWIEVVPPGSFIENKQIADGSMVSIYNELYHPINGSNYIAIYLSPFLSDTDIIGVSSGLWTVRLHGDEVRDGYFDAWIERDDPYRFNPIGPINPWRFPSFFSETSNIDNTSISSLACAHNVISVANLDEINNKVNISSSQGPTRDGRHKPEIAAPGTDIVAANGFVTDSTTQWLSLTGTSMAAPYVAGVAGLMLHHNEYLTSSQIRGILKKTARPLPGMSYKWQNDMGYGVINPKQCIKEVDLVYLREDLE